MATLTTAYTEQTATSLVDVPFHQLLCQLDQGTFSPTAYDTAWVARVMDPDVANEPSYPQALNWLRAHQHLDGSWGSDVEFAHDRILSTLSAMVALAQSGRDPGDQNAVQRAENYIWQKFDDLASSPIDTVGFELLLPVLWQQASQLGLNLPYEKCEPYQALRAEKLRLIPASLLYSRKVTSTHSLEFMGDSVMVDRLPNVQEENGSCGHSPAATAYLLQHLPNNQPARRYLDQTLNLGCGATMSAYPVEIFNKSWALYNLDLSGRLINHLSLARAHLNYLWLYWDDGQGVGFSRCFAVPDLDDTAVVFKLLRRYGYPVHPDVFLPYEREHHFTCYTFERNASVGANVHLLDALNVCPEYVRQPRMVQKIIQFLRDSRLEGAYWLDKWHISPYYITAHAVVALIGHDDDMARSAIRWILDTQRPNGSWGSRCSTCEETAYSLQALMLYGMATGAYEQKRIERGIDFLKHQPKPWDLPAMWIEKTLYTPTQIVQATILSVLALDEYLKFYRYRKGMKGAYKQKLL